MSQAKIRAGAVLLTLVLGASCSDDDDGGAPAAAARSEPSTTPEAIASTEDDSAPTTQVNGTGDDPGAPPVEFTACVGPGPSVTPGPEENVTASLPDGETTLTRRRGGYTWQSTVSGVSDPRLEGTWYNSVDKDEYSPGPGLYAVTHRVENDEGAWQGSHVILGFPDGEEAAGPVVMTGEGAYEGLAAVAMIGFGEAPCPNTRGYIVEGSVPAPPVPQTGR
jgi:hypothetical protein